MLVSMLISKFYAGGCAQIVCVGPRSPPHRPLPQLLAVLLLLLTFVKNFIQLRTPSTFANIYSDTKPCNWERVYDIHVFHSRYTSVHRCLEYVYSNKLAFVSWKWPSLLNQASKACAASDFSEGEDRAPVQRSMRSGATWSGVERRAGGRRRWPHVAVLAPDRFNQAPTTANTISGRSTPPAISLVSLHHYAPRYFFNSSRNETLQTRTLVFY